MNIRSFFLAVAIFLFASFPSQAANAPTTVTVQVVNDSGLPDNQVFVLLSGQPENGLVASIPVANSSSGFVNNPAVAAQAVSSLTNTGTTVTSQFTGQVRTVYSLTVTSISSGVLYVMYGAPGNPTASPFSYGSAAPSPISTGFRFSQLELTYDSNLVSVADLTNIDYFSIPMQLQGLTGSTVNTVSTVYMSTPTLISEFQSLGVSGALRSTTSPDPSVSGAAWTPADGYSTFARVLGPGQYAATSPTGDPAPYPSFEDYLESLVAANYTWTDIGFQNGSSFNYSGSIASDGNGGYTITLAPNTGGAPTPAPPAPLPAGSTITINLPSGTAAGATTSNNYDTYIYGCVLNHLSFSLSGSTMSSSTFDNQAPNSVYGAIVSDALAGLNFGYLNGKWGSAVANWFANIPTAAPFGAARTTNDGYYNGWAALIYNNSDSYGFAFSDRSGPSPAVPLDNTGAGTLILTILPDERLDAPLASVTAQTANSITVQWPAVASATGYTVQVVPPYPATNLTVAADGSQTYSQVISGLLPETPYSITVVATGTANGNPVQSASIPVNGMTTGTLTPTSGSIAFNMGFNWNGPDGSTITINGTDYTLAGGGITPFGITGGAGINSYPVVVQSTLPGDPSGPQQVVYTGNIFIELGGNASSYTVGPLAGAVPLGFEPYLINNVGAFLSGNNVGTGGFLTVNANSASPYGPSNVMTLGVPFNPYALKVISGIEPPTPFVPTPSPNPGPSPSHAAVAVQAQQDLKILKKDIKKTKKTQSGSEKKQTLKELKFGEKVANAVIADPSNAALDSLLTQVMKATKIKNAEKREKKFKKLEKQFNQLT